MFRTDTTIIGLNTWYTPATVLLLKIIFSSQLIKIADMESVGMEGWL